MIPAAQIKRTIDFNARFRQLLEVLKLVAVSQYHALEKKIKTFERLEEVIGEFFEWLDYGTISHPFLTPGDKPTGVIAVTSDAGLLGGMNVQVVSKALEILSQEGGRFVVIGEKGQNYARDFGVSFAYFPGVTDSEKFAQAYAIRDYLIHEVVQGAMGGVKIVYPRAISVVVHRIEIATLLPFTAIKKKEANASTQAPTPGTQGSSILFESSIAEIVEYLVYLYLGKRLSEIFGLSCLAEQAARFVHLEESCQKILDLNKKLTLQYFRRRHEMIDQNMRELFSARSLYANK